MRGLDDNAAGGAAPRTGTPSAFTMIELLVVMFILAVLVALVASVGGYVMRSANERETAAIQTILMDAIQAWHDKANSTDPNTTAKGYPKEDYPDKQKGEMQNLMTELTSSLVYPPASRAARDILLKLPKEAWSGGTDEPVKDSWGAAMRYKDSTGLGGRPVIISAGPDGNFNTDDDNIRSDEAQ
jgi:prepilin-type N-terminal cleavage/methylation domain-containing protein